MSRISPTRAGVSCRSDKRIITAPMRVTASPVLQASLSRQAIWWRGDGHPAFNWNGSVARIWKGRADHHASRHDLGGQFNEALTSSLRANGLRERAPMTSSAKQSIDQRTRMHGLLRRFAPLLKRFAFVAANDGVGASD